MFTRLRQNHRLLLLVVLGAILLLCLLLGAAFGAESISPLDILKMTLNKIGLADFSLSSAWELRNHEAILFMIRLPRVVAGALVGAALAAAGVLFQGLLRNPMADPYIIGTSAGALFGATIAMMLPVSFALSGFGLVPIAAFIGALGAVLLVYNLARVGGKTPVVSMLLAGFAVSSLLAAASFFIANLSGKHELMGKVWSFLWGSISVSGWDQIILIAPLIVGGIVLARFFAFRLNAFALGEEGAAYVGIDVEREKLLVLGLGSLLTAAAVSISGLVGFVGLVVPHAMRLVLGPDHRLLLPAAALSGGAFLVIADLFARTVRAPDEIQIGILTAIIGAPFFIYLLRRTRREYAF